MTSRDFVYWLQGYFEILDPKNEGGGCLPLGPVQTQCIREHLQYVFQHDINPPKPAPAPMVAPPPVTTLPCTQPLGGGITWTTVC